MQTIFLSMKPVGVVETSVGGGRGGSLPTPSPVLNLLAQSPYYEGGVLKVNVSWQLGKGWLQHTPIWLD